tara:strand:+ start:2587 stop:3015 length:429 start_codon:yes stop_codon:yes gene_type:complete
MFVWAKLKLLSFVAAEVATCRARYNRKCEECRSLLSKIEQMEREADGIRGEYNGLHSRIAQLETEVQQKDLVIEARDNQIMLTDQVVQQQQYMIQRDIELRHLEYLDAGIKVRLAGGQQSNPGIKDDSNGDNESGVNYRAGR